MKKHFLVLFVVSGLLLAGFQVMAGSHATKPKNSMQDAIDFRSSTMTIYKWYLKPMGLMVKGKVPFDVDVFKDKAAGLATIASLNVSEGFPKGSHEETEAKMEIWQDWDGFKKKHMALQDASMKLKMVAASGDVEAMKKQFGATAKTCKGCHDDFREKKKQ